MKYKMATVGSEFIPKVVRDSSVVHLSMPVLGFGMDELFIISKLWCNDAHPNPVIPLRLGLTKSVGVSGFTTKKLQNLLSFAKIPLSPTVSESSGNEPNLATEEAHRVLQGQQYHSDCLLSLEAKAHHGDPIMLWTTKFSMTLCWIMANPLLRMTYTTFGLAGLFLMEIYEQGTTSVPKSYNRERLKENLDIFDWKITQEDLYKISQLPQKKLNLHTSDGADPKLS
ncbi:hypothetical protein FEM48_Zijuj01G0179800 [Ziziphus jujuba var. spinosa]|uniref:Uncharacterized protein n=1 Tax=Ziziphus jujuba var. spinosa TaxID=714518 RepID=A0A978W2R0_ZIZJJ|nr:hypothetical protein FEM48_Zijuj01G0179800 [Ziziphus jujuba var. spinosa]